MSYKAKERASFWLGQIIAAGIAFFCIWIASRIGFREAVRFSRYEENRKSRDLMRSMERELASNERALGSALEDWDSDPFRRLQVVTQSLERAKESESYLRLNLQTLKALSETYSDALRETVEQIRRETDDTSVRREARDLWIHLERMERTRSLLEEDLRRFEREFGSGGVEIPFQPLVWPTEPPPDPTAEEERWMKAPASAERLAAGGVYEGNLTPAQDLGVRNLAVAALPRGPMALKYNIQLTPDRKPVRLLLCFSTRLPFESGVFAGRDDARLRRLLAGDAGEGSFAFVVPLEGTTGDIVDPNRPVGWRWVYALIEDQKGERRPVTELSSWKIGPGKFRLRPSDKARVLPIGYRARS